MVSRNAQGMSKEVYPEHGLLVEGQLETRGNNKRRGKGRWKGGLELNWGGSVITKTLKVTQSTVHGDLVWERPVKKFTVFQALKK